MAPSTETQAITELEDVVRFLKQHGLVLATAESCTCGLVSSLLAEVAGCGQVLDRGYVVYTPKAKHECLGVSYETIERYGLTSAEVAEEMALGCLRHSSATVTLSNTGLAEAPNEMGGVVYFGWAAIVDGEEVVATDCIKFPGERNEVRDAAAHYALFQMPLRLEQFWREARSVD